MESKKETIQMNLKTRKRLTENKLKVVRREGIVRDSGKVMYTVIYKMDNCIAHGTLVNVIC